MIRDEHFEQFYYEPFSKSIEEVHSLNVLKLWTDGIKNGLFQPQLHGREHLHALQWLAELRAGNQELLKAFDLKSFGIPYTPVLMKRRKNLQAALDVYGLPGEEEFKEQWVKDSAEIFKNTFGFHSRTFIAPAYIWRNNLQEILRKEGIEAMQGIKLQYQPKINGYKRIFHYTGHRKQGMKFLVRNVFFEPSLFREKDWTKETFDGIKQAFKKKQPAIIGSHRINYIGSLNEQNRTRNLAILKDILQKTVAKFPDVQFMSSDELLNEIK
jgi:hypothetical protein